MALSVNKVQLIGYVGGDPATHVATSGTAITNFSLATGESWTDKNTGKKTRADRMAPGHMLWKNR